MKPTYSNNVNQQILIALLKAHGIKKVIASPGGTNPAMVISFQTDGNFEMYSSVDERSAAYMACGMAEESGEPVIICCTGATASRNYMPGLTEAFYRKLPIIAITCSRPNYNKDNLTPQFTNRNVYPADILVEGENLQPIKDDTDFWDCEVRINRALLEMTHHGGGPIHFNVECTSQACKTTQLPPVKIIQRICKDDMFPTIPVDANRVGIFIGSHRTFDKKVQGEIESFCEKHNAVVFCDHTSGYYGKYKIQYSLIGTQQRHKFELRNLDLLIHIGEISGDYFSIDQLKGKKVWRVSEDGNVKVRFGRLDYIFEMSEYDFFKCYNDDLTNSSMSFYKECNEVYQRIYNQIPELPLSHIYVAKTLAPIMPSNCVIHFSIINALRSWNFFVIDNTIRTQCNVGGFGIDGCTSSLIGASLVNKDIIHFLFTGDLAFFYDLNAIGNRHIGKNVRILLVNDGKGAEFTHYRAADYLADRNPFVAGAGHYGNQSATFVKDMAENLGFEYMQAKSKEDFNSLYGKFISPETMDHPLFLEIITSSQGQSNAWEIISKICKPTTEEQVIATIKKTAHTIIDSIKK